MTTRTLAQALGTAIVVAALAWQCAAGRVPDSWYGVVPSDRLVPQPEDRTETAIVGARF